MHGQYFEVMFKTIKYIYISYFDWENTSQRVNARWWRVNNRRAWFIRFERAFWLTGARSSSLSICFSIYVCEVNSWNSMYGMSDFNECCFFFICLSSRAFSFDRINWLHYFLFFFINACFGTMLTLKILICYFICASCQSVRKRISFRISYAVNPRDEWKCMNKVEKNAITF